MIWTVNQTTYLVVEIVLVGIAAVVTMLAGRHWGLRSGILVAIIFAILVPGIKTILQTNEEKRRANMWSNVALTQEEYDALEQKDENTLYVILPKQKP